MTTAPHLDSRLRDVVVGNGAGLDLAYSDLAGAIRRRSVDLARITMLTMIEQVK